MIVRSAVIPNYIAVKISAHDYRFSIEPFRIAVDCLASLTDITPLIVPFDSRRPDRKQEKVRRTAYPNGNNPFVLRLPKIKNPPWLGNQNSETLLWVLTKPQTIESVFRRLLD